MKHYIDKIISGLEEIDLGQNPVELYEPLRYILSLGGKRLRPALALMSYKIFKPDFDKILVPALSIEVFHNFTLMHDDIMDEAPLRRGKTTVHEKWNTNIAILSGDVMLVKAYELLAESESQYLKEVLQKFNTCAAEVCEGQQFDMNFETEDVVHVDEYINMIRLKTAVLLGFALELGAILAGASKEDAKHLNNFGQYVGIGFQLKDDLLDVYGDAEKFGKQVGGDILCNKKTFLLIRALEKAEGVTEDQLKTWLNESNRDEEKVAAVTAIYSELEIDHETEAEIQKYFDKGFSELLKVNGDTSELQSFAENLMAREN